MCACIRHPACRDPALLDGMHPLLFHYDGAESFTNAECHIFSCGPVFGNGDTLEAKWMITCFQNEQVPVKTLFDEAVETVCRFIGWSLEHGMRNMAPDCGLYGERFLRGSLRACIAGKELGVRCAFGGLKASKCKSELCNPTSRPTAPLATLGHPCKGGVRLLGSVFFEPKHVGLPKFRMLVATFCRLLVNGPGGGRVAKALGLGDWAWCVCGLGEPDGFTPYCTVRVLLLGQSGKWLQIKADKKANRQMHRSMQLFDCQMRWAGVRRRAKLLDSGLQVCQGSQEGALHYNALKAKIFRDH